MMPLSHRTPFRFLWVADLDRGPTHRMREALHDLAGTDVEVVHRDIGDPKEIEEEYLAGEYKDLVLWGPPWKTAYLTGLDDPIRPLVAETEETSDPSRMEYTSTKTWMRFIRFQRVSEVALLHKMPDSDRRVQRILRVSGFPLYQKECSTIDRLFGRGKTLIQSPARHDPEEILLLMEANRAQALILSAPRWVVGFLTAQGICPLIPMVDHRDFILYLWAHGLTNRLVSPNTSRGRR